MRSLVPALLLLVVACEPRTPVTGLALSDTAALACEALLVPTEADDGRIGAFAPGPDGLMAWITEFGASEMRVGKSLATGAAIGRAGAGPGEFKMIYSVGWVGDTLWASDFQLSRVQFFDRTGSYLRGVQLSGQQPWIPRPDGRFVAIGSKGIGLGGWGLIGQSSATVAPDTIFYFPGPVSERITIPMGNGGSVLSTQPFAPEAVVGGTASGDRWCGVEPLEGDAIRLRCVNDRGAILRDTTFSLPGIPLDDATWEDQIKSLTDGGQVTRDAAIAAMKRPSTLPRVTSIRVDPNGAVWLNRSPRSAPVHRWLRFTPEGALRDTLLLNQTRTIRYLSGDTLWLGTANADDAITIARCVAKH